MEILEVKDVVKKFGGIAAVDRVSLKVDEGEIYCLIGPNGSGKTTLVNIISGAIRPDSGEIFFDDRNITNLVSYANERKGMVRTFQIPKLWKRLDVMTNLIIAGHGKLPDRSREELEQKALSILRFLEIERVAFNQASKISGGQAKLVEFARALMSEAKLMLLDEPFAGVSPALMKKIIDAVKKLRTERNVSFLIISHIIGTVVELSDTIGVMSSGKLIAEGEPSEVLQSKLVVEAYLGGFNILKS